MKIKRGKRGIVADYLPWLLIAVAILVILMVAIFILRGQGTSLIDKIKNIFG
jgi:hypothetical protein